MNFDIPSASISSGDIRLYRSLCLVASIVFTIFGFILKALDPQSFDPILNRIVISALILLVYILTYISGLARKVLIQLAYVLAYIISAYYMYLLYRNSFSFPYSLGVMVIIFGIAVIFKTNRLLLWYLIFSFTTICIGYILVPNTEVNFILYISIMITTSIIIYITMGSRLSYYHALNTSNLALKSAYKEIHEQKKIVESKNKNITDSINYAKRIQDVILPSSKKIRTLLPDSFIFYKPKDIVSGDFYWTELKDNQTWFSAVDCTGHGVPGAFMSIVGHNLLNQIIVDSKIDTPAKLLNRLREQLIETTHADSKKHDVKDGMDIALCSLNYDTLKLRYAGSFNSLYHCCENTLKEIKADKLTIGDDECVNMQDYSNHEVQLKKGDCIYIFTDGYADQFGGAKGKKFKYKRFKELLLSIYQKPIDQQKEIIEKTMKEWQGDLEQVDDILIIGIKINGTKKIDKEGIYRLVQ